jgi:hypothetical protein
MSTRFNKDPHLRPARKFTSEGTLEGAFGTENLAAVSEARLGRRGTTPVKLILAHNPYQQPGGEDVVFEAERRMLESAGHDVVVYRQPHTVQYFIWTGA